MADGKVSIRMNADVKDLNKQLNAVSKEFKKSADAVDKYQKKLDELERIKFSTAFGVSTQAELNAQREALAKNLSDKEKLLADYVSEYKKFQSLTSQYGELYDFSQQKGVNKGLTTIKANKMGIDMSEYNKYVAQISAMDDKLAELKSAVASAKESLTGFDQQVAMSTDVYNNFASISGANADIQQRIDEAKKSLSIEEQLVAELKSKYTELNSKISDIEAEKQVISAINTIKKFISALIAPIKKVASAVHTAFGAVAKKAVESLISPFKKLGKSIQSFGKRLKFAALQGLVFRQVRTYLSNLLQTIGTYLKTNAKFVASLNQLKGTAITAFQPLLNAAIPILIKLINWVQIAITYISALLSLFKGLSKASSSSAKAMYDQAEAMESAGGSADKFLASFDTIEKVTSGGGGGSATDTPTFDFDVDNVSEGFQQLLDKISLGDWYGTGMEVAKKLDEIISNANSWITTTFTPWCTAAGTDIADLLNGMVDGALAAPDLAQLGTLVGNFFNAISGELKNFAETFNFSEAGMLLARQVNTFFSTVDASQFADAANGIIGGLFQSLISFLETTNWTQIGSKIGEFLRDLDWSTLLNDACTAIKDAIIGGISIIEGATGLDFQWIKDGLDDVFDGMGDIIDLVSGNTSVSEWFSQLSDGQEVLVILAGAIAGVVTALTVLQTLTAIATFIQNVKSLDSSAGIFGKLLQVITLTSSGCGTLSEAFTTIFGAVTTKIIGITAIVAGAVTAVTNFISMLQGGFSWAKEALMVVGILIAALGAIILGAPATVALVVAGIVAAVGTLVVLIKEHWDSIVEGVSGVWEKVSEIFSDLWEDIKEIWESVSAWFDETVITPVCDFFTDLYKDVSKYFSDLWEDIKGVWSSVSTWFSTNVIEPITSFFKGIYDDVSKWFKTTVSPKLTATYWTDKFSGIKDGMKSAMNSVISHVESAINKIIRALNNLSIKLPEFLGGGTIGFNISEVKLPRLAQGSVVNPGHEFAAILGDNRYEQEVVSPLSTMKQAFIEALAESGYSNSGRPVVLQIDGTTFARITNPYMAKENTRIGIKAMGV